jgi:uncharacterized protein (TIGR03086 family)
MQEFGPRRASISEQRYLPTMSEIFERFTSVANDFSAVVVAVPTGAWSNPSPCAGWTARDVVRHLVDWIPGPGFLLGMYGVETGPIPSVDQDPAAAWAVVQQAIEAGLSDLQTAQRVEDCGPPGRKSFEEAIDMFCTNDLFVHTWDLAQAAGIDVALNPAELEKHVVGIADFPPELEAAMRGSGHYGPRVAVPADASPTVKVMAFFGRTPIR